MQKFANATSPILEALERPGKPKSPRRRDEKVELVGFCGEGRIAPSAISARAKGVGELGRPIEPATAQALQTASLPARYGRREATLLDKRVRDTGEIGADLLAVSWADGALQSLTSEVARVLCLPRVEARLHNLLVYGPGQFFKSHQDTEKHRGMVATLVLVWPSAHLGGELRVRHGKDEARFASQHLRLDGFRWFAFYADCQHEVCPVTEGWRVVLTYDLVVPVGLSAPAAPASASLLKAMREHFFPGEDIHTRPWVFLLDHEYTQHGLRWSLLKGEDRSRVAALRAGAEALGLTVDLGLVEICQQWTATEDYSSRRRGAEEPLPEELIDESIAVDHWVGADERPLRRAALHVRRTDVDSFTDTDESFLVDEEYEGYMGNYGETLEYWYRRAALVLQTPLAAEVNRFVTDFDAALADALVLARNGRADELARRLQPAARTLAARCRDQGRKMLRSYAALAVALPDAAHAQALCEGFIWTTFKPADAKALASLSKRWGSTWMLGLLQEWEKSRSSWLGMSAASERASDSTLWPRPLGEFVRACKRAGLDVEVVDAIWVRFLTAVREHDAALMSQSPAERNASLGQRVDIAAELVAALRLEPERTKKHLIELLHHVRDHPELYPLLNLRPLVEALPTHWDAPTEAIALTAAVVEALEQALARPEPMPDDFGLRDIEWVCRCADCRLAIDWALSSSAHPLTLAMAESRRSHLITSLRDADAAFGFDVVHKGSPHKLVISKPADLHRRYAARRKVWAEGLAALARRIRYVNAGAKTR